MLERLESPVSVERAHFLIAGSHGSVLERREHAEDAVRYLLRLQYTKTPYWKELISASGLHGIEPIEVVSTGSRTQLALCKAVNLEYAEAISILETTPAPSKEHFRNLELIAEFLILSKNFKGLEELDYRLSGISVADAVNEEVEAFARIQLLVLCGAYMQGKHLEFCKGFFRLERNDPEFLTVLKRQHEHPFMTCDEVLLMVTVSTIVATPFDNYEDLLSVENVARIRHYCPELIRCLELLTNTSFGRFLNIWHGSINEKCDKSLLLAHGWDSARSTMRSKIYFFYLRISNKLTISYLSRTLHIEEKLVEREMRLLIENAHLNFEINGDLVQYKSDHFLAPMTSKLKENYALIEKSVESQVANNKNLKDAIQGSIIGNNSGASSDLVYRSPVGNTPRYNLEEDMDIDEINDTSDVDSASFILGHDGLSKSEDG